MMQVDTGDENNNKDRREKVCNDSFLYTSKITSEQTSAVEGNYSCVGSESSEVLSSVPINYLDGTYDEDSMDPIITFAAETVAGNSMNNAQDSTVSTEGSCKDRMPIVARCLKSVTPAIVVTSTPVPSKKCARIGREELSNDSESSRNMVSHAAVDKQLSLEVDDSGTSTVADVSPATSDIESASVQLIDEDALSDEDLDVEPVQLLCRVCRSVKSDKQMAELTHHCQGSNRSVCVQCLLIAVNRSSGKQVSCPVATCSQLLSRMDLVNNIDSVEYFDHIRKQRTTIECATPNCSGSTITNMPDIGSFKCHICGTTTCFACRQRHFGVRCALMPNACTNSMEGIKLMMDVQREIYTSGCHLDVIVTCKTGRCGGWCLTAQTDMGCFECPICGRITCVGCDKQHYPFSCVDVDKLFPAPSITREEWKRLLIESLSVSFKVSSEVESLVQLFIELTDEIHKSESDRHIQDLRQQRQVVRYNLLDMTGADPNLFLWYDTNTNVFSMVKGSPRIVTTKIDMGEQLYTSLDQNTEENMKQTYLQLFQFLQDDSLTSSSGFRRLSLIATDRGSNVDIVGAYLHVNPELRANFEVELAKLISQYGENSAEATPVWLYHGTAAINVQSIFDNNFDLDVSRGMVYGRGIYFGEDPETAISYAQSRDAEMRRRCWDRYDNLPNRVKENYKYVILCKILKGVCKSNCYGASRVTTANWARVEDCDCDSHKIQSKKYFVVKNPARILPLYELIIRVDKFNQDA